MREIAVCFWDDLEAAAGRKTEASITVLLGLDGQWMELDLTEENNASLHEDLGRWLKAGRPVKDPLASMAPPREHAERKGQWKIRDWEHGRPWGEAIRQFAKDNGLEYMTPAGKYYYSRELRDAYAKSIGLE